MKRLNLSWVLFLLIACSSPKSDPSNCPVADIRAGLENPKSLKLSDEIESVDYVPLEVTSDDASLIDGVANYAVTDKYIYVLPVKEQRIVLFDRQGHFIKTLIPFGQGPGEFSGFVASMQADEKNDRLYLFSTDRVEVYTLDGEPVQHFTHDYQIIFQYKLGQGHLAAVSMPYVPFQNGSFGIGLFTEKGDTVTMKKKEVILPQAFVAAFPSLGNSFISMIKNTAIGFTIGVVDILAQAKILAASSLNFFEAYISVGVVYWVVLVVIDRLLRYMESKICKYL